MTTARGTLPAETLPLRTLRKDVGVAVVVGVCLLIGAALMQSVTTRTVAFTSPDAPISFAYPAGWQDLESLQPNVLLKVEDPLAASTFKTTLSVESRDLDPAAPPTIQQLRDRRIEQLNRLTAFKFLSDTETTVGGHKAIRMEYAYVTQPIDSPRRASLPVVVLARDYIVVAKDRSYYISLAAPENDAESADAKLDAIVRSVQIK